MNYDIFKNDKEKKDAQKALPGLEKHPGWKFIARVLEANVEYFTDQLRTKKDFRTVEEVFALQDRITDLTEFQNLPATIVEAAQDDPEEEDDSIYD